MIENKNENKDTVWGKIAKMLKGKTATDLAKDPMIHSNAKYAKMAAEKFGKSPDGKVILCNSCKRPFKTAGGLISHYANYHENDKREVA